MAKRARWLFLGPQNEASNQQHNASPIHSHDSTNFSFGINPQDKPFYNLK